MKFLKPFKGGYVLVLGNGRVLTFDENQLKVMSMAYDELRFVSEDSRRSFSMNNQIMEELLAGIKERRKTREDW